THSVPCRDGPRTTRSSTRGKKPSKRTGTRLKPTRTGDEPSYPHSHWSILSFTESAINRRAELRALKLNVRKMDLAIAAIALEQSAVLVTRNTRDFCRVSGLAVADWSSPPP